MNPWDAPEAALLAILPSSAGARTRRRVRPVADAARGPGSCSSPRWPSEPTAGECRRSSVGFPALRCRPPLRRALAAALSQLREGQPEAAAQALTQMVAPARDTSGPEAGDAIALAAKLARQALR